VPHSVACRSKGLSKMYEHAFVFVRLHENFVSDLAEEKFPVIHHNVQEIGFSFLN
jgi:hypothetical protein